MDTKEIIEILRTSESSYPKEAVQAAMDQKDDVVPSLLFELERACEDPHRYIETFGDSLFPMYVLELLGYHHVREAHPLITRLASLPGELSIDILDDGIHGVLPIALWQTCGKDPSDILALIRNREADEYCRSSAISALLYGVAEKTLSRDEVVEFLQGLFTGEESDIDHPMVWNGAASALTELWPGESMEVLQKAYDDGLIDPVFIEMEEIREQLVLSKDAALTVFEKRFRAERELSPHKRLSDWAFLSGGFRPVIPSYLGAGKLRAKRSAAKEKRKQARAARKKGRSRKKRKR